MPDPSLSRMINAFADIARNQDVVDTGKLMFNLRRAGLLASWVLILGILFLFIKLKNLNKLKTLVKKKFSRCKLDDKAIKNFFNSIEKKFKENNMLIAKLALAETENYFDKTLEEVGFKGKTLTDKLNGIQERFMPNLEQLKSAHAQIQNILDGEDYQLTDIEANWIVTVFKEGIENLKKL